MSAPAEKEIRGECAALADMLVAKNAAYGNSVLDPVRVFSQAPAIEQIMVRIDDKLSRLKRGTAAGEDVVTDLIGYLIMLRIAQKRADLEFLATQLEAVHAAAGPGVEVKFPPGYGKAEGRVPDGWAVRKGVDGHVTRVRVPAPGQMVPLSETLERVPGSGPDERFDK